MKSSLSRVLFPSSRKMASYKVGFSKRVRKDFRKIVKADANRILGAIGKLADDPRPAGAKKLKGEELYRLRVGVYRVVYEIFDDHLVVTVVRVAHRKGVYRK